MKTIFSTSELSRRDRFDYWHSMARKTIVDHDAEPQDRLSFQAEMQFASLGEIEFILFKNSPMTVDHRAGHIAYATDDHLFVCRQVAGRLALEQDGRQVILESGDIALLDPRRPYRGRFSEASRLLVLKVPRFELGSRLGETRDLATRAMPRTDGDTSLTSTLLAILTNHVDRLSPATEKAAKYYMLHLLAIGFEKLRGVGL
jgi:AraC family transcriptional activator of tynA and feaB